MISHFTQLSILIFGGFLSFETTVRRDKGTMMLSVVVPAAAGKTASVRHAAAGTNRLARYLIVLARSKKFPTQNFLVLYGVFLLITAMKVQQG